ncbi:hypothetical protein CesoFtcFv8_024098 [Champsocephalus esox]|uniref:Uncharacterized protein n=1 Tax=Champsocephalus esox TaxID=159716 RepID=A0AAN8B530_9TELE|nr:hypothetical protein CesoFtcFv8_024098 [Champsocephalus esox]
MAWGCTTTSTVAQNGQRKHDWAFFFQHAEACRRQQGGGAKGLQQGLSLLRLHSQAQRERGPLPPRPPAPPRPPTPSRGTASSLE